MGRIEKNRLLIFESARCLNDSAISVVEKQEIKSLYVPNKIPVRSADRVWLTATYKPEKGQGVIFVFFVYCSYTLHKISITS